MELPLIGVQRIIEWSSGYQLVHLVSGAICFVGALSIHVPCMQLFLETLTLMGLNASQDYPHVLHLHVSYTPRAWIPRDLGFPHISCI